MYKLKMSCIRVEHLLVLLAHTWHMKMIRVALESHLIVHVTANMCKKAIIEFN